MISLEGARFECNKKYLTKISSVQAVNDSAHTKYSLWSVTGREYAVVSLLESAGVVVVTGVGRSKKKP